MGLIAEFFACERQLSPCAKCDMDVKRPRPSIAGPDGLFHHRGPRSWSSWLWKLCGLYCLDRDDGAICFVWYRPRDDQVRGAEPECAASLSRQRASGDVGLGNGPD